ncbi:hypothetical protein E1218_10240 [Kribbella turkmenica]|uniref:Uncharacterized protein n=1 Tax=Kribbella turkmenica TaxID=2530375 RepID=A0A4R4XAF2_9ACTN|nr:hypothetical protein E1218_10240 [Kribbella turkmenica]
MITSCAQHGKTLTPSGASGEVGDHRAGGKQGHEAKVDRRGARCRTRGGADASDFAPASEASGTAAGATCAVGHANGTATVINSLGKVGNATFADPIDFRWAWVDFAEDLNGE